MEWITSCGFLCPACFVGLLDAGRSSRDPEDSSAASADGSVCWARLGQTGSEWTQENPRDLRTKSSTASLRHRIGSPRKVTRKTTHMTKNTPSSVIPSIGSRMDKMIVVMAGGMAKYSRYRGATISSEEAHS